MNHARQPRICPACMGEFQSRVEKDGDPAYGYCPHGQALAIIKVEDNRIANWSVHGPFTHDEANEFALELGQWAVKEFMVPAGSSH